MSKINDGGPAYPLQSIGPEFTQGHSGISLRDHFAGQALTEFSSLVDVKIIHTVNVVAELCYIMADAMLAARAKGGDADG